MRGFPRHESDLYAPVSRLRCSRSLSRRVAWHVAYSVVSLTHRNQSPYHLSSLNAFALDLFGFGMYTFPHRAAGALYFHDPLEGTEINQCRSQTAANGP